MIPMTFTEFCKAHRPTRCFQRFDHLTRAEHAASHRLGYLQKHRVGDFYYVIPDYIPDRAFDTCAWAKSAGYAAYLERMEVVQTIQRCVRASLQKIKVREAA